MKGQHITIWVAGIRLVPHVFAGGQLDGPRVTEAAYPAKGAEVVIERTILLHHKDDVFHVLDGAGSVIGRKCERAGNACGKGRGGCTCGEKLQEGATVCTHKVTVPFWITYGGNRAAQLSPRLF